MPPFEPREAIKDLKLFEHDGSQPYPMTGLTVCVDPGDVHCGTSFFADRPETEIGFQCVAAKEFSPDQWLDVLAELIVSGRIKTLVYERFRLYGDKAQEQKGSEFITAQIIGTMRWMVRKQNEHAALHYDVPDPSVLDCVAEGYCNPRRIPQPVQMVGQMADIKKPTKAILNRRNIRSLARRQKAGQHCVDAEMHGWHWLLNGKPRDIEIRPSMDSRHVQNGR